MNRVEIKNNICVIILDNKPQNYLTSPEFISYPLVEEAILQEHCKAILFKGAGRHFSAGADINTIHTLAKEGTLHHEMEKGKELLLKIKGFQLPIFACIEGACFGGGLEIALNADIRIASEKSIFAFPEANSDLMPGLGGSVNLPRQVGTASALEIILGGNTIDAGKARAIGLVDYVYPSKTTFEEGLKLAEKMTRGKDPEVIKAVVESVRNADILSVEDAQKRETELFCSLAKRIVNP